MKTDLEKDVEVDVIKLATTLNKWVEERWDDWKNQYKLNNFNFSLSLLSNGEVILNISSSIYTSDTKLPPVGYPLVKANI